MKAFSPYTLFPHQLLQHLNNIYWNYQNSNFSYTELSHRSKYYADLNIACMNDVKKLLKVEENYQVIFLAVGQTYPALPFNLLKITNGHAFYLVNGQQSNKNCKEGSKHDSNVKKVSSLHQLQIQEKYLKSQNKKFYTCYNFKQTYEAGEDMQKLQEYNQNKILICDLSYCINIQQIDVSKHGIVHFKSGSGIGILGTQVLVVRKDLINQHLQNCPDVLDLQFGVRMKSIINTPSTLSTLVLKQNIEYLLNKNKDQNSIKSKLRQIKQAKLQEIKEVQGIQILKNKRQSINSIKFRVTQKEIYNQQNWKQYFKYDNYFNCYQVILQQENQHFLLNKLFIKNV